MFYDVNCTNGGHYVLAHSGRTIYQSTNFDDVLALGFFACKQDEIHQVRILDSTRKKIASGQKTLTLEEIQRLYQPPEPSKEALSALQEWRLPFKRAEPAGGADRTGAEEQPLETTDNEKPEPMSQSEKSRAQRARLVFNSSHARKMFFKARADQAWEAFLRNGGKADDEHAWQKYVQARFKLAVQAWEEFQPEDSGSSEKAERASFISAAQAGKVNHQSR
jgi:hypothetical protein